MGDVFENYSDPEADPLTQLPPKHLLYYNLGLKMPGGPIDEEETPRSDEEDAEEELSAAGGSEVKPTPSSYRNPNTIPTVNTIISPFAPPPVPSFPPPATFVCPPSSSVPLPSYFASTTFLLEHPVGRVFSL